MAERAAKQKKMKEIRGQSAEDLRSQIEELRRDLWQQRIKAKDGSLQQTHGIGATRRQIAKRLTVLSEHASQQQTAARSRAAS